jgi:acyl-CoA thioester hydrolase
VITFGVDPRDIDAYQHVNNAVYLVWLDQVAWSHSAELGLPIERCVSLGFGMAVTRTVICYLRAALAGDQIETATWLIPGSGRLRVARRFQIRRANDHETLVRAEIEYACIELKSGRPARWPAEFRERYVVRADVASLLHGLAPL